MLSDNPAKQRALSRYNTAINIRKDGAINFSNYKRASHMAILTARHGLDKPDLLVCGDAPGAQSTRVHPQVATYTAMQSSPTFAASVTEWIEEWKNISKDNQDIYARAIDRLTASPSRPEASLVAQLAMEYSGKTYIPTPSGVADVVTYEYVIKVSHISKWKQAIGHAQVYALDTNLKPTVYLFTIDYPHTHTPEAATEHLLGPATEMELKRVRPYFEKLGVILLNDKHKLCIFDPLPRRSILIFITAALAIDIRSVGGLAVNRRIWELTRGIWPTIARSQLYIPPYGGRMGPEESIAAFVKEPNKLKMRALGLQGNGTKDTPMYSITIHDDTSMSIRMGTIELCFERRYVESIDWYRYTLTGIVLPRAQSSLIDRLLAPKKSLSPELVNKHYSAILYFTSKVVSEFARDIMPLKSFKQSNG